MPSTSTARRRARARQRSIDSMGDAAKPSWRNVAGAMTAAVVKAFRQGSPVNHALIIASDDLQGSMIDAMVATHLKARFDVFNNAALGFARKLNPKRLDIVQDSIAFLAERMNLDDAEIERLRDLYGDEAIEISGEFTRHVNDRLIATVGESLEAGEHVDLGVKRLRRAFQDLGIDEDRDYALEAIFRTQTQVAFSAGEWNAEQDPDIQEILWGYEYIATGDDRVRPEHEAMDGIRLPKDDPFWETNNPPNGWNCRCSKVPIFDTDDHTLVHAVPIDIGGVMVKPVPDEGWDFNPGLVFRDLMPRGTGKKAAAMLARLSPRDRILMALHTLGGRAKQVEIARHVGRGKSTISERVNAMVDEGTVEHDPACQWCALTPAGERRLARLV